MPTLEQARRWYADSDPVHGFDHILRVYRMAERIAQAEGADLEIVRAAVLLHDAEDPLGSETDRLHHHHASASFARKILSTEGWEERRIRAVEHCIQAHRFRDPSLAPQTLEAQILFDADKLDAIGAIGVARAIAFAAGAGQPAYQTPSARFRESGERDPGEAHSAYHEYIFKLSKLKDLLYTHTARQVAAGRHHHMVAFFDRLEAEMHGEL